jgi:hypothetical protein
VRGKIENHSNPCAIAAPEAPPPSPSVASWSDAAADHPLDDFPRAARDGMRLRYA